MQSLFVTAKHAVRRVIAPVARPLWRRVRPRIARIRDVFRMSDAWHQYLPALTNAVASVGAVSREQARMKKDYDAAIAELRASVQALQGAPAGGVRLHLGPQPQDGYTNIDTHAAPGIDIVTGFDSLPFRPGEVSEICVQGMDRIPAQELGGKLLPYWMGLLKAGGTFRAVK
jgi:hypothetical protein